LKWRLPGDISGGLMIFGIMFAIAIIEMYVLRAFQGTGGLTAASLRGGGGGAGNQKSGRGGGSGGTTSCTRKGGAWVCEEENKKA